MINLAARMLNWIKNNKPLVSILVGFVIIVYVFNIPIMKGIETIYLGDNYHEAKIDKKLSQHKYQVKIKKAQKMKAEIDKMTNAIETDTTQEKYGKSFNDIENIRDDKTSKYEQYYQENSKYLSDSNLPERLKYN